MRSSILGSPQAVLWFASKTENEAEHLISGESTICRKREGNTQFRFSCLYIAKSVPAHGQTPRRAEP
jgi:hypothetical protein